MFVFVFEQGLAAGSAGGYGGVLEGAPFFCGYGQGDDFFSRVVGAGPEYCGAFGAGAGGEGGVFLVCAGDYSAVGKEQGCPNVEITVGGVGSFGGFFCGVDEAAVIGGEFLVRGGEEGYGDLFGLHAEGNFVTFAKVIKFYL